MNIFIVALIMSSFLCSLVAGFLLSYAIVVMPGIKSLDDKSFIKTFKVTDRIIQNNNPVFILMWLGSILSILTCMVTSFSYLNSTYLYIINMTGLVYLIGVQFLTIFINIPLNNELQRINVDTLSWDETKLLRDKFENRWNKSNRIRTCFACFCISYVNSFFYKS